jgi:hypothetical protein
MVYKALLSIILVAVGAGGAVAQELVDISHSCAYYRQGIDEDVYSFNPDQQTEEIARRIMNLVGAPTNFRLMAANVPSVLAVIHGEERLVLYNTDFVYPTTPGDDHDMMILAVIAHAIAHHVMQHTFPAQADRGAEVEADEFRAIEFTGFTLARLGEDHDHVLSLIEQGALVPTVPELPARERCIEEMLSGWHMADSETAAMAGDGDDYGSEDEDNGDDEIPSFDWPPPKASARVRVALEFDDTTDKTLADVSRTLEEAFFSAGYVEFSYFAVPDGFALVSRLEQIEADGTPMEEPDRWSTRVRAIKKFSLGAYVRALFRATPGRFRIVVFIVTPVPFSQEDREVTSDEAEGWITGGGDALPRSIGDIAVTRDTKCTALIYEFLKPTRDDDAVLKDPSELTARTHLQKSTLWESLGL